MSRRLTHTLAHEDVEIISVVVDRYPGKLGLIARRAFIDYGTFQGRLALDARMTQSVYRKYTALASKLRIDAEGTLREWGVIEPAFDVDTNMVLSTARQLEREEYFPVALDVLMSAFTRLSRVRTTETAAELLPQIIYTAYRLCPLDVAFHRISMLYRDIKEHRDRRTKLGDDQLRAICRGQLACALNEGGMASAAQELFEASSTRAILKTDDAPAWMRPQLLRNQAHYAVWYGDGREALDRALALVKEAACDQSVRNRHAVAHSLCDIFLSRQDYAKAWEVIADRYFITRQCLSPANRWTPTNDLSVLLAYGILLSGTIARSATRALAYSDSDQRDDLATLDYWLNRFGGRVESGHVRELPVLKVAPDALSRITLAARKTPLNRGQAALFANLAHLLE